MLGFVLDESRNSVDTNECDPIDEAGCIVIDDVGGVTGVIKNPPPTPNIPESTPTIPPSPKRRKAFTETSAMGR